jgi:hypothetical protein
LKFLYIQLLTTNDHSCGLPAPNSTYRNFKVAEKVGTPFRVYHFLNHGDRLKPYLLYAFLRNFIERASVFDFEPVFIYNLKGCQIVAGGRSIA